MKHITQAFVLAGGRGERLKPLTDTVPKPLIRVAGKPILEYTVELLARQGIGDIVLGTGYLHEKVEEHFGSGKKYGARIRYAVEHEPLGTGGALKAAKELLKDSFFMLNGDNIADYDFAALGQKHFSSKATATITLVEAGNTAGFGVAKTLGNKIIRFEEKPNPKDTKTGLVNAGAYVIEKKSLELLPRGFSLIEKTLFPELAKLGKLYHYKHEGFWLTTDTPERIIKAEEALKTISLGKGNYSKPMK